MKKISLFIIIAGLITLISCEKPWTLATLGTSPTKSALTLPTAGTTIVLTKATANDSVKFTWSAADFGLPLGTTYTVQIGKSGKKFATAVDVISANKLKAGMKQSEFNSKLVALEANMDVANAIIMRVKASVPGTTALYSDSIATTITPYTAKDNLYMVGNFNGWNNGTAPALNRNLTGLKYELYLDLAGGSGDGFKLLPTIGSWNNDMGDDPANPGKLLVTGENNMTVPTAGYYRISVDLSAMTWSALKTTWGVIGDFNGWGGDAAMTYDAVNKVFKATITTTAAGGLKFRANGGWTLNYGDNGADGKLDDGGSNIAIAGAGSYTLTLNLNPTGNPQFYTYTVVKN
jgi:hypothetical protein